MQKENEQNLRWNFRVGTTKLNALARKKYKAEGLSMAEYMNKLLSQDVECDEILPRHRVKFLGVDAEKIKKLTA